MLLESPAGSACFLIALERPNHAKGIGIFDAAFRSARIRPIESPVMPKSSRFREIGNIGVRFLEAPPPMNSP